MLLALSGMRSIFNQSDRWQLYDIQCQTQFKQIKYKYTPRVFNTALLHKVEIIIMQQCVVPLLQKSLYLPGLNQSRKFWEYVNMMFNKPDPDRLKKVGPDRACAEWVLRNGGRVTWADGKKLADYNLLPSEEHQVPKLVEIDGTDSSISHYGFSHLSGCTMLKKIILHNNNYIDNRALKGLTYGKDVLSFVQISKCDNVTDPGLKELVVLKNLETLVLYDLASVQNIDECKQFIASGLPTCKISGDAEKI